MIEKQVEAIQASPEMAQVRKWHQSLIALEDISGDAHTSLAEVFGFNKDDASPVRFDEFVGLSALEAAKKYLKKRDDARPFDEIVEMIEQGGGKVDSKDTLRTQLSRSTVDIIKIGDRYGALEKYPHVKRGGKSTRRAMSEGANDAVTVEAQAPEGDSGTSAT
jgi:hypothetical protein